MSTCPLQVWLWLTGPSCWLDVYLADITSRLLERVSCHAGGRVVTTNVTNNVTLINIYFLISLFLSSAWVILFVLFTINILLDNISDSFHNLLHCRGSPHKLTPAGEMWGDVTMSRSWLTCRWGRSSPQAWCDKPRRPGDHWSTARFSRPEITTITVTGCD